MGFQISSLTTFADLDSAWILVCLFWISDLFSLFFILLLCGDIETNPGPKSNPNVCRVLYANVRGLAKNLRDVSLVAQAHDIIICSETIVSSFRHKSELVIPGFSEPMLIRRDAA